MPRKIAVHRKTASGKAWPPSTVSRAEYNYFIKEYKGYSFRIPTASESPLDVQPGELCIFNEFFKVGLSLPLPEFLIVFCNEGKVLPGMLMPNTMAMLNGLYKFFVKWGISWKLENVLSLLTFTEKSGLFYGQPKHSSEFKMIGIPSSRHGWKSRYFFAKSQEPWPISVNIPFPHAQSFKGWGNSEEIVGLKKGYDNKPFCLHVETLEVTPLEAPEVKRKALEERASPAKKGKATVVESEEEAQTGSSNEGDEASIQWSEYEAEATTAEKPAKKAVKSVDATGTEIGTEEDIPSSMRKILAEESSKRSGKEPGGSDSPVECYYNCTENTYYLKQNSKYRYIPDMSSSEVPYAVSSIFLHPEDKNKLQTTSFADLGLLQAQMSMGVTHIGKFFCEQLQYIEKENMKLRQDKESASAHFLKQRETVVTLREKTGLLTAQLADGKADFEKALAEKDAELESLRTQKNTAEELLLKEREEWARKERISKEVIEGLKSSIAKKAVLPSGQQSKEQIISEYKQSSEFESILKGFSEHGYVLLMKHLEKNKLLSKEQLEKINYDTCIEEASDEESDNR